MERSVKSILQERLNQFHGTNLALNSDVAQETFGKVRSLKSFSTGHLTIQNESTFCQHNDWLSNLTKNW